MGDSMELDNKYKEHPRKRDVKGQYFPEDPVFKKKKYRLYDKINKLVRVYNLAELLKKFFDTARFEYRGECTGLKDKNGKEIYEGDILLNGAKEAHFIVDDIRDTWEVGGSCKVGEVVGNIYENKELLNANY
jgi:hypothetical protein